MRAAKATNDKGETRDIMLEMFSLKGRVALVTGSSRGLGWAMAQALSSAGAHIVLNGRDAATLKPRFAELQQAGGTATIAPFDVTDLDAVRSGEQRRARHTQPGARPDRD